MSTNPTPKLPKAEPAILEMYMRLTPCPASRPAEIANWQRRGRTEPTRPAVTKNAGALAKKGIFQAIIVATRGGRYTDNPPAKSSNPPITSSNVSGLHLAVSLSDRMQPA